MALKKAPPSLEDLCLQSFCQPLLQNWKNTYFTDYYGFAEQFHKEITIVIPPIFYNNVFDFMLDSLAKFIKKEKEYVPSISGLVCSLMSPVLRKLNLNSLRCIGIVPEEDINFLLETFVFKLPLCDKLSQISLRTSSNDFTLPVCTDEILEIIGFNCFQLTHLDVSHNVEVTDNGIKTLIPSEDHRGCPKLCFLWLFECSVSCKGIVDMMKGLPELKSLGYRETGQAIRLLYNSSLSHTDIKPLELAHINNMGISNISRSVYMLECDRTLVSIISALCPKIDGLKVRVSDASVMWLHKLTTLTSLSLVYNLGRYCSPSMNTVEYFHLCGSQIVKLSIECDIFDSRLWKAICDHCSNLKYLNIQSKTYNCDTTEITALQKNKCALTKLRIFKFRTCNFSQSQHCSPFKDLYYALHKSFVLREIHLIIRDSHLNDAYIGNLFSSIYTKYLKKIWIGIPFSTNEDDLTYLSLSMVSVDFLIQRCPVLQELGRLFEWDLTYEDIEEFKRRLQLVNSALCVS